MDRRLSTNSLVRHAFSVSAIVRLAFLAACSHADPPPATAPVVVATPPTPIETGRICDTNGGSALSGGVSPTAACGRPCMPDETRNAAGCCVPATPQGTAAESTLGCPAGQARGADTEGHCCWSGQVWTNSCCVGRPTGCPEHYQATSEGCVLPACSEGRIRMADGVHCCYAGQGWSSQRNVCVGTPTNCPPGYTHVSSLEEYSEECWPLLAPSGFYEYDGSSICEYHSENGVDYHREFRERYETEASRNFGHSIAERCQSYYAGHHSDHNGCSPHLELFQVSLQRNGLQCVLHGSNGDVSCCH